MFEPRTTCAFVRTRSRGSTMPEPFPCCAPTAIKTCTAPRRRSSATRPGTGIGMSVRLSGTFGHLELRLYGFAPADENGFEATVHILAAQNTLQLVHVGDRFVIERNENVAKLHTGFFCRRAWHDIQNDE